MTRVHDGLKRMDSKRVPHAGGKGIDADFISSGSEQSTTIPLAEIGSSRRSDPDSFLNSAHSCGWDPDPDVLLRFDSKEAVPGTEEFRALRASLYQIRERIHLRRILISSAVASEGRSFMAANVAQVMACQHGCRTLLLDADLRAPSLHLALGTSATPGLSDYLLGEVNDSDIIQRGTIDNLFFVPAGRLVSGQSELLSNGHLKTFLDGVSSLFDWIIIDSTAALAVSDTAIIANYCEGALMIVRANSTPFDVVFKAREKIRADRILGVVLNQIRSDFQKGGHSAQPDSSGIVQEWKLNRKFSAAQPRTRKETQAG